MKWFRKSKSKRKGNSCLEDEVTQVVEQNKQILEQNEALMQIIRTMSSQRADEEEPKKIEQGFFDVKVGAMDWRVCGYSSIVPDADFDYFPGLKMEPKKIDGVNYNYVKEKVISCIVPCYTESAKELKRTIRSLYRQRIPPGWRIEAVIVMDGANRIDSTMAELLSTMFGVCFNSGNPDNDPFLQLPGSETIIVHPLNEEAALTRTPIMENSVGGLSLVVKRTNQRKANSQMWWLGPHASTIGCKYALATDCGTVFARTATVHLIRRLDAEEQLHAVTGFQRIMSSEMQGDGSWECFHDPMAHVLRMLQRFEFEVDHVSFKAIYDTIGCMHVIPGPCGLFRYSAMGSLKQGLMQQYFSLFQRSTRGVIIGNVELVEDRIPGTLLSFPTKDYWDPEDMPEEGWPRTGFVYEAVFFVEAEKPLSQLVKQRRRWLNGTFATYLWMLSEGIVTQSNQDPVTKVLSWLLVLVNVIQGVVVRCFGPALLIVWMFRFGLFLPDVVNDPKVIFDPETNLREVEFEKGRFFYGLLSGGIYALLYVAFIVGHIPRAKPVKEHNSIVRYTEPSAYCSDKSSSFRGWLFYSVLWINAFVVVLYIANTIGIVATLGWDETPFVVQTLIWICFCPFIMGLLDSAIRGDLRCLWGMVLSAPAALPLMIWFTVWLPAYATTRLSDLTWGNRVGTGIDESKKALKRARDGQKVAWFLICFNLAAATGVIAAMQVYGNAFPIFVLFYTLVLSSTFLLSFIDWAYRFFTCQNCYSSTSEDSLIIESDDDEQEVVSSEYVNMSKMEKTANEGSDTSESAATDDNSEALYVGAPITVDSRASSNAKLDGTDTPDSTKAEVDETKEGSNHGAVEDTLP